MYLGSSRVLCRGQDPEAKYGWIGLPQGKELRTGDGDRDVHR